MTREIGHKDNLAAMITSPIAAALYYFGGIPWLVWGVSVRVAACTTMHWFISYFAHTQGPQSWLVDGAGVQAHDVPIAAVREGAKYIMYQGRRKPQET